MQELLAAKDQELQALKQEKVQGKVQGMIGKAVAEAKGDADLLEPFIAKRTRTVVGEDGKIGVQVFKDDGTPMLTSDGNPASLKDLMNEFKNSPKFGRMFEADNRAGSGAKTNAVAAGGVDNPFMKGPSFNVSKQMELYRSNPELAKIMASQAGMKL